MWRLIALGLFAFACFIVATLPATLITDRLAVTGVSAQGVQGSVWNGRAEQVQVSGTNLGQLQWRLHPLTLFTGKIAADIDLRGIGDAISAVVAAGFGGRISIANLRGDMPLSLFPHTALPGGWSGQLNVDLAKLQLLNGWPVDAAGTLQVNDLTGPTQQPKKLGSFRVVFPAAAGNSNALIGKLESLSGPLDATGTLKFNRDRSYVIDGQVVARPNAPPEMINALQYLGAPEANGKYPFSVAGTM